MIRADFLRSPFKQATLFSMSINRDKKAQSDYINQLEKAQEERIEEMFEELKQCKIKSISEISSKNRFK